MDVGRWNNLVTGKYDYKHLADTLINVVASTSNLKMIESNSSGPQPDYPFWTYTIISPYLSITSDIVTGEQFEVVISLTCHAMSSLEVLNQAMNLNKDFRSFEILNYLKQTGITLVELSNTTKRDNFISIDYERLSGFDMRLRVRDSYVDDVEMIDNIEL
ncbi:hypothetical protein GLO25_14125 [Carnobacterium maltaromaticum]|jgi:GTP:adenosylcobinamide-phosphate guanylyltransferase|nr:hypothetical protein [Carnobacterium maltaromaticum]